MKGNYKLTKGYFLLFAAMLFSCFAFAQTTVTISATGTAGSFRTGSVSSAGVKNDGNMININSGANRGWAYYDLSTIPAGSTVTAVNAIFTTFSTTVSGATNNLYGFTGDPASMTGTALYTAAGAGTSISAASWAVGLNTLALNATGLSFIQSNAGLYANIGYVRGSTNNYNIYGYGAAAADVPKLQITYTLPPACTGTPTAGTITGAASVCEGGSVSLAISGASTGDGITYQWASSTTAGGPYTNLGTNLMQSTGPLTTTTYYVATVTCTNTASSSVTPEFTVTVNPTPVVSVSPSSSDICMPGGTAVALTASGATSYAWGPSAGLSATTGATVNALPTSTTTYTVTGTTGTCSATATATVTINRTPVISSVTATPADICVGGNSQLLASAYIPATANNYVFATSTGATLDPMTGATTLLTTSNDDTPTATPTAIGFTFPYEFANYTQFSVSPDGWLLLGGTTATSQFTNAMTSATNAPKISAYWDDNATGTNGYVKSLVTGTAPNRILKVEWFVTIPRNISGAANSTFQMWLYEGSGKIELRYGTMGTPTSVTISAGLTGLTSTNVNSITFSSNTASATANDANTTAPATGRMYTFTMPAPTAYTWTPATYLSSTTIANPMANAVAATTTYSVTASNGTCTSASSSVTITAGAPLVATVTPAPGATVCQGTNVTLNTAVTGGGAPYTYSWSGPSGFTSTAQNPVLNSIAVAASGTYTVTVTDNCGTITTANTTLLVNPLPTVTASPTSAVICSPGGSAVSITASGATTYAWLPTTGLTPSTGATVSANPANTTTYTVTGTDGNGCSSTATAAITVARIPVISSVTATPSAICVGGNSQLQAQAYIPVTANNYVFATSTGASLDPMTGATTILTTSNDDTPNATPLAIGFTFPYEFANYTQFSVSPDGWVLLGGTAAVSQFTNAMTSATNAPKISAYWDDNATGTTGAVKSLVTGTAPNRILKIEWFVTVPRNTTGAANSRFQMWLYEGTGNIEFRYGTMGTPTSGSISAGLTGLTSTNVNSITFSSNTASATANDANTTAPATGRMYTFSMPVPTYAWTPATYLSSTTISNPMANAVAATTTYSVTASNLTCSSAPSSVTLVAGAPLVATITPAPGATVCQGTNVTLNTAVTGGGAPYTYSWSGPSSFTSTAQNPVLNSVAVAASGTYTVTVTDNCGTITTATTTLVVNPLPTVTANPTSGLICNPGGTAVSITASGASTYTWLPTAGLTPSTGATVSANPTATTTYTVTGTDANGCVSTATAAITVGTSPLTPTATAAPAAICTGSNAVLTASASLPTPTYCQPTYSTGTGSGDYVSSVQLNTLNNTSAGAASPYYTLYPASGSTTTTLVAGNTYTITLVAGTYTVNDLAAWIDFNQNGVLNNAGEKLGEFDNLGASPASTSFTFTVPLTAFNGTTRLRVREMDHGTTNDMDPCTAQSAWGETEDYIITITGGASPFTWAWTPSTFLSATTGATVNVNAATATTTYTATATSGVGCTATATTTLTVNPLPVVTATASDNEVCAGDMVTLNGGGAVSYTWDNSVTDNVAFAATDTTTYTVTGTDANGCVNTASTTVIVNPLPVVTATASDNEVCAGDMITLNGGGAVSYTWDNGATDNVAFAATDTTTYTVTGTDVNGCMNTASTTVIVNPLPVVTATASDTEVCIGDMVTLMGGGAVSYTWDNGVTDNVAFAAMATTVYTVTGTDANGCMNTAPITITVNPLPVVTATASDNEVCVGDMVTLMGGGAVSYTWDNGVTDNVAFAAMDTTVYTVTGTDANGCVNTASTTVIVNPLPTVTATASDNDVCAGDMITLMGGGAVSYTWDNGVTDNVAFAATDTTTYTVTGTDVNGCMNTASTTVIVKPLPVVTATSSNDTVCAGDSVTVMGGGAVSYIWDNGVTDNVAFAAMSTTLYTVTGTDMNGCSNTASVTVNVHALPAVTATATDNDLCIGESVTLTGGGASTYVWDNSVTDNVAFSPTSTALYTVTGTDTNGCVNTASTTVTVNALPTVTASASDNVICFGETTTLMGGGAATYTWTGGALDNTPFSPTATATYTVTGTDVNGCVNTASTTVTVNTLPAVSLAAFNPDTVCFQTPGFTLTGGVPSGGVYSGTGVITGLFNPASAGVGAFPITYTVTDANSCSNSATSIMNVADCTGIEEAVSAADVEVYPNPTSGLFNISINNANFEVISISIVNIQGKEVFSVTEKNASNVYNKQISLESLAKGLYYVRLTTDSTMSIKKLILQ
jgi:hypothetical protein